MCGIAVAIGWGDQAPAVVERLAAGLMHRGDITDPVISPLPGSAMCTRRLRIVDARHGVQPQTSFDGALVVAFNGEIYNHAELREELSRLGARFSTASDTEVLANALRIWGAEALPRLIGMYAFVALELGSGEFLAARDPFGVKPLYLMRSEDRGYLFCSEIKPLLDAVDEGEVLLLPPGHLLTHRALVDFGSPERICARESPRRSASPETLDSLLAAAVERRIPPDLPFATFFSGGIDSTLIAHYARRFSPQAPGYFLGDARSPDFAFAASYADATAYDLRLVPIDHERLLTSELITAVVGATESFEPEIVRTALCSYLLAECMHQDGFRVALCGEGADELFAGYLPLELAFGDDAALGQDVRLQCLSSMHRTNLQRIDRCTMRFALETREPFLDPSVVEHALALDPAALLDRRDGRPVGKAPLRQIYDLYPDALPRGIRDRTKLPFNEGSGFDASADQSPWCSLAEDLISDTELEDGRRRFESFGINTKEELLYMSKLAETIDVHRVPHLTGRTKLHLRSEFIDAHKHEAGWRT